MTFKSLSHEKAYCLKSLIRKAIIACTPVLCCLPLNAATNEVAGVPVKLEDFLKQVWVRNESLQIRILESAIADERYKAEKGLFEPELVMGADAVDRRRANTEEQRRNLGGIFGGGPSVYNERNKTFTSGIESTAPTGAKVRLGYTLQTFENNVNAAANPHGEWITTVGLTLTQPLLKNGGVTVTTAGIRAAAITSEISFQDYRKNIMEIIGQAEAAYWDLYQTQQQLAVAKESLRIAETLHADNKKRFELGKGAEIEMKVSEAAISERIAIVNEAQQRLQTARSKAATLLSDSWSSMALNMVAADVPNLAKQDYDVMKMTQAAFEQNPAYASLVKQAELEGLRVKVAKNQRMPNLDLKGGYGFSGLAKNPGDSWNAAQDQDFPSWSLGVEFRVPLGGGVKSRHELRAAELRREATARALNGMGINLANTLRSSVFTVESHRSSVELYGQALKANEEVFNTQVARLDAGKVDSREVLDAEEDVFRARLAALETQVRYQKALLELDIITGTMLKERNLDFTQQQLQESTSVLVNGAITTEKYNEFLKTMQMEYDKRRPPIIRTP
ncbi:MAG TPA: TolC family protein [Verrucomicrobiae bacterium]